MLMLISCTGKVLSKHKHFIEVDDISTQFELFNFTSDAIRAVSFVCCVAYVCVCVHVCVCLRVYASLYVCACCVGSCELVHA